MTDTISFHVQLTSTLSSFRELYPEQEPLNNDGTKAGQRPVVRVFLLRKIIAAAFEQKATRNVVMGEGELSALPPSATLDANKQSLDWQGTVRCTTNTSTGGFSVSSLTVKVGTFSK